MGFTHASRARPNGEKLEKELWRMRYRNHLRLLIYETNDVIERFDGSGDVHEKLSQLIDALDAEMSEDAERHPKLYRSKSLGRRVD